MTDEVYADRALRAALPPAERIQLVESILVSFPRHDRVCEKIAYCHDHSKVAAEPECLLVTGPTGAGKTTIREIYARRYPRRRTQEGAHIPVLSTSIPVPASPKSLVTRLLAALGDPLADRGTTVGQTLRLAHLLKACGVELIILDEFQHFIDRESNHILLTVANWLKDLLNETNVPVVLMGMPYSDVILRANAQLERRFGAVDRIEPFGWDTPGGQAEFRTFLRFVDGALPLEAISGLCDQEMARRVHFASGGVVGSCMKLIRRAAVLAITRGLVRVDIDLLAEVFDERFAARAGKGPNPFRADLDSLSTPRIEGEAETTHLSPTRRARMRGEAAASLRIRAQSPRAKVNRR